MNYLATGGGGGSEYGGADGTGLIDPDLFPLTSADLDLEGVFDAATAFSTMGERVETRSADLTDSWSPLSAPGVYSAPEGHRVHVLMKPAVEAGEDFAASASTAAGALLTFWMTLTMTFVPGRLKSLEDEARAFRDEVRDGVPRPPGSQLQRLVDTIQGDTDETVEWYESLEHVKRNEELLLSYANILESISEAACTAAETIQDIPGMPDLPDPEPYDADAIGASSMPWGSPRAELNMDTQIGLGVIGTATTVAKNLAALAGWDGSSAWPSLSVAGNSWKGLGNGLLGLAILGGHRGGASDEEIERLMNSDDPLERWYGRRLRDGRGMVMPLVAGNSVDLEDAADRWSKNPWQVGTETALSWLLLFAPGPKVGKSVPMSPAARTMLNDMLGKAELVRTGSGWFTKGGIRVADASGRWLGDVLYGGSKGKPGGEHMWHPGEPEPTPSDGHGGKHKPGKHKP